MVFLPDQVAEYDKKRACRLPQAPQMELFVSDERSAIDWLTDFLKQRPSTYQELHPEFITPTWCGWKKHEAKPELAALLENNFLKYDGGGDVPSQIHSYLSTNHKDLRGLDKSRSAAYRQGARIAGTCRTRTRPRPGEEAREGAAEGVRGYQDCDRSQAQGVPPGGPARRLQGSVGGARTTRPSSRSPRRSPKRRCRKTRSCSSGTTRH